MIADWYKNQGYHFLALSDHNLLSRGDKWMDVALANKRGDIGGLARYRERFGMVGSNSAIKRASSKSGSSRSMSSAAVRRVGKFLMIQAEEITDKFEKLPVHINAHNLREAIRPQGGASVRENDCQQHRGGRSSEPITRSPRSWPISIIRTSIGA